MLVTVEGGSYHAPAHTIELLTLYPNPSDGEVTLHIGQDQWIGGSVIVYNILSQQMAQSTISKTSIDMDFSTQSAGVYLVVIQKGTAQETLQLIKN